MNTFAADPHWGWWIVGYFFLGGIAAGAYAVATLIELFGREEDRPLARAGNLIAFPLIVVCGVLLILDLNQPLRFWHMLFKSEVVHGAIEAGWPTSGEGWSRMADAPTLKYWSPMSIGSWAIALFSLCSFVSFAGAVRTRGWTARLLSRWWFGGPVRLVGCAVGFFVASYTGVLLTATNQPIWSNTHWVAPLFLASAASTGIAAIVLLVRKRDAVSATSLARLERADLWALAMELAVILLFFASLGSLLMTVWSTTSGKLLVLGMLPLGVLVPLAIHLRRGGTGTRAVTVAAVLVLLGGLAMRYAVLGLPSELLARGAASGGAHAEANFGPEAGRVRGQRGADVGNRPDELTPRSKVFDQGGS